jgi:2',3'-cyclic-nucleotide 2'-phosphodiesterase (5'-nucleotidase family)
MKRIYSLFLLIIVSVITLIASFAASGGKPGHRRLVLLYSALARGQIRSCNCTKFRFGGYGRELTLLKQIRSVEKDVVLVEGGDSVGDTGFQAELKADVTAKALRILGYAAMVPGEEELGIRGTRYLDKFVRYSVSVLCGNLLSRGSTQRCYPSHKIVVTQSGELPSIGV